MPGEVWYKDISMNTLQSKKTTEILTIILVFYKYLDRVILA